MNIERTERVIHEKVVTLTLTEGEAATVRHALYGVKFLTDTSIIKARYGEEAGRLWKMFDDAKVGEE